MGFGIVGILNGRDFDTVINGRTLDCEYHMQIPVQVLLLTGWGTLVKSIYLWVSSLKRDYDTYCKN